MKLISVLFPLTFATLQLIFSTAGEEIVQCKDLSKALSYQNLAGYKAFAKALADAQGQGNGGFGLNMWGTVVSREGKVCMVSRTGENPGDQWPGSRVISAQKANTANSFSLDGYALSTANLYNPTQPGNSLFGLQESNPVNAKLAYNGAWDKFGTSKDPMNGKRIGGVNVFGGGLALYKDGKVIGAIGVSGDSSCADHNIAWRVRKSLGLDTIPAGPAEDTDDRLIVGDHPFSHPDCGGAEISIGATLGSVLN